MLCLPTHTVDRGYSSGSPVVKRRDRMRREATWTPTDGHALAPPSSHLILTQLRGLVFERWGSSRPHSKQVARIWAKNSLTPKHTPASIWNSFHKEALNKSTLNYILNQEFAYLKLEAETLAAKAARTHIKRAFVLYQNLLSSVNIKKIGHFLIHW